jgi:type VI protein secretion system component Hcp
MTLVGSVLRRRVLVSITAGALALTAIWLAGADQRQGGRGLRAPGAAMLARIQLAAAVSHNIFLHIHGFNGDTTAKAHKGDSAVTSFSSSDSNTADATTSQDPQNIYSTEGRIKITKPVDAYTTQIEDATAAPVLLSKVSIYFDRTVSSKLVDVVEYDLVDAYITSDQLSFRTSGTPTQTLTLGYGMETIKYWPLKSDGSRGTPLTFCRDFRNSGACT